MEVSMALISWNDSLCVKVREIDQQHKQLISMINELHDTMKQGKSKDVIDKILEGLFNYSVTHFKTEENYFDRFGYAEKENHKMEHAAFIKKIADFNKVDNAKHGLSIEIMNFLSDWLKNHIKVVDMKYSQFFNEKGLK
jgi:hemerythrin